MSRLSRFLLIVGFVLPAWAAPLPVAAAPSLPLTATQRLLQQLDGVPCPDDSEFTCITIDMPLDHFNPADTRTIPVTFAVLAATGERKGMFVTATGGPGSSGIAVADSYTSALDPQIPEVFDSVYFDQRGVALSGGLTCPEAAAALYQTDSRAQTPAQESALKQAARKFSQACVREMGNPEILPYLGTNQAVEDLETFREMIGDEKLWLYGESYGTQFAQTYATAHGDHVAGLLLDGTVDLTLDLFDYYVGQSQAFNDALEGSLAQCDEDEACTADLGSPSLAAYDKLAARLGRRGVSIRYPLAAGGYENRSFTLSDLETAAAGQMYTEGDRMMFTRALASYARSSDLVPLARLVYLSLGVDADTLEAIPDPSYSDGMYYSVECQDYGLPGATATARANAYLKAGDPVEASLPRLASLFYGDLPCAYWPDAQTDTARPEAQAFPGIPTIVLGATADPATPVGNGQSVFERLDDGYLITQQGGPHVIFGRGNACPDETVTDFLVNDTLPSEREMECEGVVADDYVPLPPRFATEFEDQLEALASAETEIYYLPEYYYWDGLTEGGAGCGRGGTLTFDPEQPGYAFMLDKCAFTRQFVMTGSGVYDGENDEFTLDVTTTGRWACDLLYVRSGEETTVTGNCGGTEVELGE